MSDDKNMRHRFTVPKGDDVVNEWIETQSNLGFSLRVLIKAFVRQYGMKDATFVEFGRAVQKQGRPRKEDGISYDRMDKKIFATTDEEPESNLTQETEVVQVKTVSEPKLAETKVEVKPVASTQPVAVEQTVADEDDAGNNSEAISNVNANVDENGQVDIDTLF